ncbi:glutathione S-transferase [Microbulbifer agarilyticus]|uniref:glutathione S-transferase family protein n=1 Tax=Microbulbifer agarilyticus TaxID=260552 RepID=UPI001C981075|nr:glutathione S-transferase family protein [Microbulbifer agarilyticus]MBY6190134.1 glutathione S-transferase [Microbulbifer agarilyticus]
MDYRLYYWNIPFRGVFVELLLHEVGASYQRLGASEIYPEKSLQIDNPGMAPPYLYDYGMQKTIAQLPAIMLHLAHKYDYLPRSVEEQTMALKAILDCGDVLMEVTRFYGLQMWDKAAWETFRERRLSRWMQLFEKTGREYGLQQDRGFMLGNSISVADIAVTALFGTLTHCYPALAADLNRQAPSLAALIQRIEQRPALADFLAQQRQHYGRAYCGGDIERSLQQVLG